MESNNMISFQVSSYDDLTSFPNEGTHSCASGDYFSLLYTGDMSHFYGWFQTNGSPDSLTIDDLITRNAFLSRQIGPSDQSSIFITISYEFAKLKGFPDSGNGGVPSPAPVAPTGDNSFMLFPDEKSIRLWAREEVFLILGIKPTELPDNTSTTTTADPSTTTAPSTTTTADPSTTTTTTTTSTTTTVNPEKIVINTSNENPNVAFSSGVVGSYAVGEQCTINYDGDLTHWAGWYLFVSDGIGGVYKFLSSTPQYTFEVTEEFRDRFIIAMSQEGVNALPS